MTPPGVDCRLAGPPAGPRGTRRCDRSAHARRPRFVAVAVVLLVACSLTACGDKSPSEPASRAKQERQEQAPVRVVGKALPEFNESGQDPAIGRRAPVVVGSDFSGTPVQIGPGGQPKLVLFVAHWCPHCRREVPRLSKWIASRKAPKGVDIVTVATGTNANAPNYPPSRWLEREKWTTPVMADSGSDDAAKAFGLDAYPFFTLLRADNTVVARMSGEVAVDDLATSLQKLTRTGSQP